MADTELTQKLARRQIFNDQEEGSPEQVVHQVFNPYTEFPEFSRKEIKEYKKTFNRFDIGTDGFIDLEDLKRMMEKLGVPQTHISLKDMIHKVDEDKEKKISFREFLLIFRKAKDGDLSTDSGLDQLAKVAEIDVEQAGVGAAKTFLKRKSRNKDGTINLKKKFALNKKNDDERTKNEDNVKQPSKKKQTFSTKLLYEMVLSSMDQSSY
ncbi:EF-hand domain-containing protein D2 homolog isoform X1 [Tachypleus tridentatus]|uniref:EF-hand domain-containing protein D2 homolog isoform X1 n=1 Tax=Tachypleus tridentatus TaxID=6853 RepID=UPI003FD241B8